MQLGKALLGGIIGAAVGIGLLIAAYLIFQIDQAWLAIPVALFTGLGVRMMVSTWGRASYARGALTGVLALAAYLGGWFLVAGIATQRANAQPQRPTDAARAEQRDDMAGDAEARAEAASPAAVDTPFERGSGVTSMRRAATPRSFSTFDFIWLCVAALIAYELGRGSGAKPVEMTEPAEEPVPQGVHPDA